MTLRHAGFFRELEHGDQQAPSIHESTGGEPPPERERIAHYLRAGTVIATTGELVDDILDPGQQGVAVLEVLTDGTWLWPSDLAHYVEAHNAVVPPDFLDHMRAQAWTPPELSDERVAEVCEEASRPPTYS